ncbi:MAG: hypothetical protein ABJF23_03105 [Bryobacteraceae bacterium]
MRSRWQAGGNFTMQLAAPFAANVSRDQANGNGPKTTGKSNGR